MNRFNLRHSFATDSASRINIVVPMKDPTAAKQRLRPALSDEVRSALALEMFENTLAFFSRLFADYNLLVVTDARSIRNIADRYGCSVLLEPEADGLCNAIDRATAWSLRQGYQAQLVIPADIARLNVDEVSRLINKLGENDSLHQGVVIADAKDGGTNALLSCPPDAIPFCYGEDSAAAHQQQAISRGLPCQRLRLKDLSQDIDLPEDMRHLDRSTGLDHHKARTSRGGAAHV
ncbi:2-phospho-L-lactate guanylyltransferase [Marinobacterium jannaschii]|uniref:2-phospho-L-lactate guanylyltransferase n=1 Tax=Marinobacterium jannaschii TaxID=64970 RepID=UPI0006866C42|nr:2-phospho-L-lactate guanylyltransferase [Marinobacterium jannaschii]